MKFFTRERYEAMQHDSRRAEREWERAGREYTRQLELVRQRLPESARKLCDLTLHDGIVERIERPAQDTVRLIVNASNNPWGPRGRFDLQFLGVNPLTFREPAVRDCWLYEEMHLSDSGFALHVLLHKSEMIVEASSVTVRTVENAG